MAVDSFPWDNASATDLDRAKHSQVLASYFYKLNGYKSGIYAPVGDKGSVEPNGGMSVVVRKADGGIQGVQYDMPADEIVTLADAGTLPRYDIIVMRKDELGRACDVSVVQGVASASPTFPTLEHTNTLEDIGYAAIYVGSLSTEITANEIQDLRQNAAYMHHLPVVGDVDLTSYGNQYQAAVNNYAQLAASVTKETLPMTVGVQTYTHTYNAETHVHNLIGSGNNGKFEVEYAFTTGDTWAVNGTAATAYQGADEFDGELRVGGVMPFYINGDELNFSGASGLKLKVVGGTSAPSNPSENMIWVKTETPIKNITFLTSVPDDWIDGDVCVVLPQKNEYAQFFCETEGLMLPVRNTYQREDGVAQKKPMYLYKSGEWSKDTNNLYILGVEAFPFEYFLQPNATASVTKNEIAIGETASTSFRGVVQTVEQITMDGFSTMRITYQVSSYHSTSDETRPYVGLSKKKDLQPTDNFNVMENGTKLNDFSGTIDVDISDDDGMYYIAVGKGYAEELTVTEITFL